jgi:predicted metal-dependent HD superfamily phosphohydrolase
MFANEFNERWQGLWQTAPLAHLPAPDPTALRERYRQPHRAYHNLEHIIASLGELDQFYAAGQASQPAVALALFYHDAVYDPRASDNEMQSAALAGRDLGRLLPAPLMADITRLILVTDHRRPAMQRDEQLIVDSDLSILGRPAEEFARYDAAIREEYSHVPEKAYRAGRTRILQQFLDRPRLYRTEFFFEQYEAKARVNLINALAQLRQGLP